MKSKDFSGRPRPFQRKIIASPEDYVPLSDQCEVVGAFNAGATLFRNRENLEVLLMIRVAETPIVNLEQENMYLPQESRFLPYFNILNRNVKKFEMKFDKISKGDIIREGKKEIELKFHNRLKHISLPRIMKLDENFDLIERQQSPAMYPCWEFERFGLEDLRITPIQDKKILDELGYNYAITYVTPHRSNRVSTYIALTNDFINFKKLPFGDTPRRIIRGKDVALFPEKCLSPHKPLNKKNREYQYVALTRPDEHASIARPGIGVAYSPDLTAWGLEHDINGDSLDGKIRGTGSSPLKIGNLWIEAFHEISREGDNNHYKTRLMGLDSKNPWIKKYVSDVFLERKDYYSLIPEKGYVPNVVYTTGVVEKDGAISFFSGVDDTWTVVDRFYTEDVIKFLEKGNSSL